MSTFKPDIGIPVLTEVIEAPLQMQPGHAQIDTSLSSPAPAPAVPDMDWERLERELHERVLQQVLKRIDSMLEQRVRDSLADVLQTAVDHLADELRRGLQSTVKEVITKAVAEELNAAQVSKR